MSIEPVLHKLVSMLAEAGVHIPNDQLAKTNFIEIYDPNPVLIHEIFKRFAYIRFDCSFYKADDAQCIDWDDGGLLFQCGMDYSASEFYFGYRRPFYITIEWDEDSEDEEPLFYDEVLTYEFRFEPNDELRQEHIVRIIESSEAETLDGFFRELDSLDGYHFPIEKCKPRRLEIHHSD